MEEGEGIAIFEPDEDATKTPSTAFPQEPFYRDVLAAIDNEDAKSYFMQMLGYEPVYDDKGRFLGYRKAKTPDFDDQLVGLLSAIRSGKVMAIADLKGIDPLTPLEVEWTVEQLQELILLQAPPDVDIMAYLAPMEWAKLEMKKNMTLASEGKVIRALLGIPFVSENVPTPIEAPQEREQRKAGLLGKLLGRE